MVADNDYAVGQLVEAVSNSTIWNKTDDLHPWDFGDNYVSHMTWSDEKPAEQTARILFEAMGGEGGVVRDREREAHADTGVGRGARLCRRGGLHGRALDDAHRRVLTL